MGSISLLTGHVELLGNGNLSVTTWDYAIVFTSFTYKTNNNIYLQGEIVILWWIQVNNCKLRIMI